MSVRLFVGNLPYEARDTDVRQHFAAVGPPVQVFLPVDRETGRPRGFAFVEFADRGMAEEAISRFNNQPFMGRTISVSEARARESRPPSSGPPPRFDRPPPRVSAESGEQPGSGGREFGPDAPRRRRGKPARGSARPERAKRGPIPVRSGGQFRSLEDDEEADGPAVEELENFDDFSRRQPEDAEGDEDIET